MNNPQLRATTGSTMQSEGRTIKTALAQLAAGGMGPADIADHAMVTWRQIDTALSPIIGNGGVGALYKRSLFLARTRHAWLTTVQTSAPADDFAGLRAALALQSSSEAAAANAALLQTFHDLLTSLIGASLTERLLRPVWAPLTGGDAAQDTTP